jgi:hypothetical protein
MSLSDVWTTVGIVLSSLGGGAVVVVGLSTWIGKVWADRILEKDRAKYAGEVAKVTAALEAASRVYQARLERPILVNRVQFETEFKALSDIWREVNSYRAAMAAVRPSMSLSPLGETDEEKEKRFWERFSVSVEALQRLQDAVDGISPFYPSDLHALLGELIQIGKKEYTRIKINRYPLFSGEWFDDGDANREAVMTLTERVSDSIRARIAALSVYDPPQPAAVQGG